MKVPTVSRRIWLVISTVIITAACFAYYFLVYMENRRADLEAKKFRMLNQYAENIVNGYAELIKKDQQISISTKTPIPQANIDSAWIKAIRPIIRQSDFNALIFEVDGDILKQTFNNKLNEDILVKTILNKDNAGVVRRTDVEINNDTYLVFIHEFELSNLRWRIFGFCIRDQFESQVRAVDLIYLLIASLFVILMALMMPLLKLWIMNESEKLQTMNVWFCGFSLVVGSSFLLVILLMANDYFVQYDSVSIRKPSQYLDKDRMARIVELSQEVECRFTEELTAIFQQVRDGEKIYDSMRHVAFDTARLYQNAHHLLRYSYRHFNEILWIKKNGDIDLTIATHDQKYSDILNLSKRKYFSQALANDTWMLPGNEVTRDRFALQSIHSYFSNRHEAGFGVNLGSTYDCARVLAIATKLHSVMTPLLPPGYQFAIIDNTGKVWFHSRTERNLNENFFDETGWDNKLVAAVEGRATVPLELQYDRANQHAYIKAIQNTGLYLVTLHNDEYFSTPIVLTVGLASALVFSLFFIQGVHQLILLLTTYRFSLLKIRRFFLAWLRPQKDRVRIYRRGVYLQALLLIVIGLVSVSFHELYFISFFFTLPVYLTVYHYFSLEKDSARRAYRSSAFNASLFLVVSGLLVLFINVSGYFYLDAFVFVGTGLVQGVVVGILWACYAGHPDPTEEATRSWQWLPRFVKTRLDRFDNCYYIFLFLWLCLASLVPTYYFYNVGYYEEGKVWTRYLQLEAAQAQEFRDGQIADEFKDFDFVRQQEMNAKGNYVSTTNEVCDGLRAPFLDDAMSALPDLVFRYSPPLSGRAELSRTTLFPKAGDDRWRTSSHGEVVQMKYRTRKGNLRYYHSAFVPYYFLKGDYSILFMVIAALGLVALYQTLRFCVTHIFGLGLLSKSVYSGINLLPAARHFVVGLPQSGKATLVKSIIEAEGIATRNVYYHDISTADQLVISKDCQVLVIVNFHVDLNNHESNQRKLERFETLKNNGRIRIIVVSSLDPAAMLEFYERLASYYQKEKRDNELEGNYRKCMQAYRKWKNILSGYGIYYHALKEQSKFSDPDINYELNHGQYLRQLATQLPSSIHTQREREEMILEVETRSQLYYHAIWNCLSAQEKFLLHDLAKDRFVNMRNMKTIRALRQKGLLVVRNSLHIMNKSFNNFILSVVEEDDEVRMEEQMRKKGSWNTLHLILVVVIVGIVAFLGIAQQELFENFQAIVGVMVALLPVLARVGGIFGAKSKE